MERVEDWLIDFRLSGCQTIWTAWFARFAGSPERHSGARNMKMKLNLPFMVTLKVKLPSCDGGGEGMQNSGLVL